MNLVLYLKERHFILFISILVFFSLNLFSFNILFNYLQTGEYRTGLIISKNDGRQFDRMSDNFMNEGKFVKPYSQEGYHSSIFYRGFVYLVALIKKSFGSNWQKIYIFINGLFLCSTAFISSIFLSPNRRVPFVFMVSILLIITNLDIIINSWNLLPDLMLAMCVSSSFVLVAIGVSKENKHCFISALLISFFSIFIRPNGIFLFIIIIGLCIFWLLPKKRNQLIAFFIPLIIGVSVLFIATFTTSFIVTYPISTETVPPPFNKILSQMMELNYFGDNIAHETYIGTMMVNFPYKFWIETDGSWGELMLACFQRLPRVFEYSNPAAPNVLNLYNVIYYTVLSSTFILYVVTSIRLWSKNSSHIIFLSCFIGYLFIFCSLSMIETRFLLVIKINMIIGSAIAIEGLIYKILSSKKMI